MKYPNNEIDDNTYSKYTDDDIELINARIEIILLKYETLLNLHQEYHSAELEPQKEEKIRL